VKLAVVVQRYGAEISGGAELHARYIAEHLAKHAEVEVLTTCARDYIAWRNEFPAGTDQLNGLPIRRFPVSRERHPKTFARRSEQVFHHTHSLADELAWIESEGPTSPSLVRYIQSSLTRYDFFIFFSYRYYHAYHGIRAAAPRAVLVPTAERDPAIGLEIFRPVFRGVRALMFNSFEERDLIGAASGGGDLPGVVVGVGSEVPSDTDPQRFREKYGINGRFAIYVGRVDENKGCKDLFWHFERYARATPGGLSLVLVGASILPVPDHPRVRHLGFLPDQDKFDAIAASEVLVMPSYLESLSMVLLEAWALGRPVLANAKCDVLKGQCLRSNAGLYYENGAEFTEALRWIATSSPLVQELGVNGRAYYRRHYRWPVVEKRYVDMLDRLKGEPDERAGRRPRLEPLPGWIARRQKKIPAAAEVVAQLPQGPSRTLNGD